MPPLTLTPDGGAPITVEVAVDDGFETPEDGGQILERCFDMSLASIVIDGETATWSGFDVRTVPMSEADAASLLAALSAVGTVEVDGDLVDNVARTCRVEAARRSIGVLRDQERVEFRLREVGP